MILRDLGPRTEFWWIGRMWILVSVHPDGAATVTEKSRLFCQRIKGDLEVRERYGVLEARDWTW